MAARAEMDILRFDIPVHPTDPIQGLERFGHLPDNP
jgi:hypothetical protein